MEHQKLIHIPNKKTLFAVTYLKEKQRIYLSAYMTAKDGSTFPLKKNGKFKSVFIEADFYYDFITNLNEFLKKDKNVRILKLDENNFIIFTRFDYKEKVYISITNFKDLKESNLSFEEINNEIKLYANSGSKVSILEEEAKNEVMTGLEEFEVYLMNEAIIDDGIGLLSKDDIQSF